MNNVNNVEQSQNNFETEDNNERILNFFIKSNNLTQKPQNNS